MNPILWFLAGKPLILCQDCKWNKDKYCLNPRIGEKDYVTGKSEHLADSERKFRVKNGCGRWARCFEPREKPNG